MRIRTLALAAGCLVLLAACAAPRAIGQGDVSHLKGGAIAAYASQADGADAAFAQAIRSAAISRLGAAPGQARPAYLAQVGVGKTPPAIGVSGATDLSDSKAWRAPPVRDHWWMRWSGKASLRTVTLTIMDAATGKTIAWSSVRTRQEDPSKVAEVLVAALRTPGER